MKVRDVMTSDVRTCRPETNLADAVRHMWDGDCGALPVVNDEGRVTGMITDRDICIAVATRGRSADRIAVREVTQGHAYTCLAEDDSHSGPADDENAQDPTPASGRCRGSYTGHAVAERRCDACRRGLAHRGGEHAGEHLRASASGRLGRGGVDVCRPPVAP